jgi:hypothetical protein
MYLGQMLKAIMLRKASVFGQDDWTDLPWRGRVKTAEQRSYDYGFRLAAILEEADRLCDPEEDDRDWSRTTRLIESANALQAHLEELCATYCEPFLREKSSTRDKSHPEQPRIFPGKTAVELYHLLTVLNVWSTQLLLGFVADGLRSRLIDALEQRGIPTASKNHAKRLCDACGKYSNQCTLSDIATAILKYLPFCLGLDATDFIAIRVFYPVTVALWQFRHYEHQTRQGLKLARQISERRNIRFTQGGYCVMALIPVIARDDGGLLGSGDVAYLSRWEWLKPLA